MSETRSNDAYAFTGHSNVNAASTSNGLNRIATKSGTAFAYNGDGNLTSDGSASYGYDLENRLTVGTAPTQTVLYHGPLGRIWASATNSGTTQYVHDGDELVDEYSVDTGGIVNRPVRGDAADEIVAWYDGAGVSISRTNTTPLICWNRGG